jgi:tetratricopeptide (TPR) repeat protein
MKERRERLLARAESSLREAISVEDIALSHTLYAELLLNQERNDEAEVELRKAQEKSPSPAEEAAIESGLGNIAMRGEHFNEAIAHFQRVAEINPEYPSIWFNMGFAYRLLGDLAAAQENYQRGLQLQPDDERIYAELIAISMNQEQKTQARQIALQGVRSNPESAYLHALYASVLFESGDIRSAQHELQEAEKLDPELDIVKSVREYMNKAKKRS